MPRARVKSTGSASLRSPCLPGARSTAERAREKKLRDDPMAIVVSPIYVDCKRCGSRIKLSSKSSYDTFHWRTHRTRCLKKKSGSQKARRTKNTPSSPETSGGTAAATPPEESQESHEFPPMSKPPEICSKGSIRLADNSSYFASSDLMTSVASAVLKKPDSRFDNFLSLVTHSSREFPKPPSASQLRWHQPSNIESRRSDPCRYRFRDEMDEMDEMRMRQEAVESLALLSRSG